LPLCATPVANLPLVSSIGVNGTSSTGGKFATGVVDTDGKFAAVVVDTRSNFATHVVDIRGAP
jgi:hypothetical protein